MTKQLRYLCTLLLCMIASVGWADSYKITFGYNTNSATQITSNTGKLTVIKSGDAYVVDKPFTVNTGNAYYGDTQTCIRIGKSGAASSLSITLSDAGKVNATSIVVNCKNTGGKNSNATLNVNNAGAQTTTEEEADYTFNVSGMIDQITLEGSAAIYIYSIKIIYSSGGSTLAPCDLALTDAPVELSFDLYNNNTPQTINYTTTSTGAVTVSASDYITTSIDETNKTITVTPTAKTPSAQTITVNQAADANYDEGSATFTVNITDSNPNQPITLWSEDFSSYQANDVPSEGIYNYFCTNGSGNTKVYNENTAGGTSPELLVGKTQGSFSATITDLKNCQGNTATISFITNNTSLAVSIKDQNNNSVEVTGDVLSKQTSTLEFIIPDDATSLTITFTTTNSSNSRLDDIVLLASAISLPRISAENASISYNETSGEIVYTLSKPATDGVLTASTESGWLTLGTVGETVPFTCTTNDAGTERTATVTLTYTYNTNETITKDVTVTQAANPNFAMTIADVRAQGTGSVVTKGVVTSCVASESNGKINYTAYIQDATAAICVFGANLTVGDEIRVSGTLSTYNGLLEITNPEVTVLSNGNTVAPETMTIEKVNSSTNQGWLVKIVDATVTAISGQNTTIAQDEHTIVVRGITGIEYTVGDILTLTGNIGCFNTVQIANPTDVEKKVLTPVTLTFTGVPETITKGETTICKVTAEPSVEGITYSSSDENIVQVGSETGEITAMGIGTATITANYAGDSDHSSATASYTIQVIGAPHTATFYVNGDKLSELTVNEGSDIEFPVVEEQEINGKKFVGWTTAAIDGTTNDRPDLVTSATMGDANVAYYAVYANGDVQKENKSIVITSETENVPSSYGTAKTFTEYTLEGIKFKIQQMYKNGEKLQWRAAGNENGTGTMYNTETLALQSVVLAYDKSDSNKNFTLKVGNSENPTDGLEISVSEDKTTFDCSSANASYFVLTNGTGAGYLTSLTINYVEEIGTYSDYCTTVESEEPVVEPSVPAPITAGYYRIKNVGNGKYVNVAGRKTVTFVDNDATATAAGTVLKVESNDKGQVQVLRSQAIDLPGYADKAMKYVPEVVQLVVNKLHAEGSGAILGENGLDKIMEKFDASFDYHLYTEQAEGGIRIYGKTPSMRPVVEFYNENKDNVDAKLPMLEDFINDAINKILDKTGGRGKSILVPFSLLTVWENMGGTASGLTKPENDATKLTFLQEVLSNEQNVWDFAYHTAMIYWGKVKEHPRYDEFKGKLGDYAKYIDKIEYIRPNVKYYLATDGTNLDVLSQDNELVKNGDVALWSLEERRDFKVTFNEENVLNDKYYTTLYTDFAYDLPEDGSVKAYKVTEVNPTTGVAVKVALESVPAQTPVLLESESAGAKTLTLNTDEGTAPTDNILVGADAIINEYDINESQVVSLFEFALEVLGESTYNEYLAKYEHLMDRNSGTVNNKFFFGLTTKELGEGADEEGLISARSLAMQDNLLGFYENWDVSANHAFLLNKDYDPVKLFLKGDIDRDGDVDNDDLKALIKIILGTDTEEDNYDYDAAHVNDDEDIDIADVTALVNILNTLQTQTNN